MDEVQLVEITFMMVCMARHNIYYLFYDTWVMLNAWSGDNNWYPHVRNYTKCYYSSLRTWASGYIGGRDIKVHSVNVLGYI